MRTRIAPSLQFHRREHMLPCTLCHVLELSCSSPKWVTVIWKRILRSLGAHRRAGGCSASDDFRLVSLCCRYPKRLQKKRKWISVCMCALASHTHTHTHTLDWEYNYLPSDEKYLGINKVCGCVWVCVCVCVCV